MGWIEGKFTGNSSGRIFRFDAAGSEHARDVWIQAIRTNIAWTGVETKANEQPQDPFAAFDLSIVVGKQQALDFCSLHVAWPELKNHADLKGLGVSAGIP